MTGWDIKGPSGLQALLGPVAVCLTCGGRESSSVVAHAGLKDPIVPWRGQQVAVLVLRRMECLLRPAASGWGGSWGAGLQGLSSIVCKSLGLSPGLVPGLCQDTDRNQQVPHGICSVSLPLEKDQLHVLSLVLQMREPWLL